MRTQNVWLIILAMAVLTYILSCTEGFRGAGSPGGPRGSSTPHGGPGAHVGAARGHGGSQGGGGGRIWGGWAGISSYGGGGGSGSGIGWWPYGFTPSPAATDCYYSGCPDGEACVVDEHSLRSCARVV